MDNNLAKITNVIKKFNLDMIPTKQKFKIESSAYIKYNFSTRSRISEIMRYEGEFQLLLGEQSWLEAKKGRISVCISKEQIAIMPLQKVVTDEFYKTNNGVLKFALGETPDGEIAVGDITKMINILIAGTPGSGKSTMINVIINCLIQEPPEKVQLLLMDLKKVELSKYYKLPHLVKPIVIEPEDALNELMWLISEMRLRYEKLENAGVSNIKTYREKGYDMPYLVVIIDEISLLMFDDDKKIVEKQFAKIASLGRACGIHLIIATQRPEKNIVTPLIKANIDTRIAFHVASHVDSMIILDKTGAEKLKQGGDMILRDRDGYQRILSCYISNDEINENIERACRQFKRVPLEELYLGYTEPEKYDEFEELYNRALGFIRENKKCNRWALKRHLRIGDRKVDEIMERLRIEGIISHKKIGYDYQILKEV